MAVIKLIPPQNQGVFRRIQLDSGRVVCPRLDPWDPKYDDGQVTVEHEDDALNLEREGWTRVSSPVVDSPVSKTVDRIEKIYATIDEINTRCARIEAFDRATKTAPARYDAGLMN